MALFASLAAVLLSGRHQRARAQAAGIRSHDWIYTAVADLRAGEMVGLVVADLAGGELCLSPGAVTGVYTSPVVTSPFSFNAIAPYWQATVPGGSALHVELRAYAQRGSWSPWYPFDGVGQPAPDGSFYPETPLLVSQGLHFQYRLTLTAAATGQSPVLEAMTVTAIDATAGPTTSQAKAATRPGQVRLQAVPQPAVILRDAWEADESLRYDDQGDLIWPLEYQPVAKIVVHHTVSVNDYEEDEAAGWVRAIYYYHAVTLGWGDIGYNYLADKYGNIYEGRYGGPDVVGGHVYGYNYGSVGIGAIGTYGNEPGSILPTDEALAALRDLAAWEANRSYVHPLEIAPFYDAVTPNLAGHLDYPPGTTACPGDYLYAELPALRQATWQRIVTHSDPYQADWLAWNSPPRVLLAGETYSLTMAVRNTGWFTWPQAGVTNAVRLGYHWFDEGSQPVLQPPQDDHRGSLDRDITFGHAYTFTPALFTTPITPGVYALTWDMVRGGITWFHDANPASPLLTMTLSLTDTPPVTIAGELLDVRGRPVSDGQVALPNWLTVTARSNAAYALPRLARAAYTLTASAEGYASLPPAYAVDATGGDVTYPFVFASHSFTNLIANGDFERDLDGWMPGGLAAGPPVVTATAHTGLGAAQLGGRPFSGSVWLSQTVGLPGQTLSPTLSLLYRVPSAGQGAAFQAVLASGTAAITHALPLTAPGTAITPWRHFWADVPAVWQGPLCLKLELSQSSSPTPTTVLVDEVWLGYQSLESHITYLPLALKTHTPPRRSELIASGSSEETGAWEVVEATYPAGAVISYTAAVTLNTYPYADHLSVRHNETYNMDYARLNWDAYNAVSPRPAPQSYELLVVENDYLKLTFLPQLGGRLYQAFFKPTGNNELYGNSVVKPTGWGPPEQRWWLAAGGMEWGLPVEEHGYEWGVPWQAQTVKAADGITVTLRDSDDPDRLRAAVSVLLPADRSYFVVRPRIENAREGPLTYKYWTNAMLAPGPANTVSPDLRFIYPVEEVTVHSTGDPALPGEGQAMSWPEYGGRDMSRLGNWREWLGFFERPAAQGDFTAVYDPSVDEGMVRVFPSDQARGAKGFAFGWQKALPASLWTDDGSYYVEMHGGIAPTFWDSASLDAGDVYQWEETWYPVAGIGGVTTANREAALHLQKTGDSFDVGLFPTSAHADAWLGLWQRDTCARLWQARLAGVSPAEPFRASVPAAGLEADDVALLFLNQDDRLLAAVNLADCLPPTSSVAPLPSYHLTTTVPISWSGEDGQSGVTSYDVQVRDFYSDTWTAWLTETTQTSALFDGRDGHTYLFRSRARDGAGNVEAWPSGTWGDTFTSLLATPAPVLVTSTKEPSRANLPPGSAVTYTLSARNSGNLTAVARLTDTLPAVLTLLTGSLSATLGTPAGGDGYVTWEGQVAAGAWVTVTYAVSPTADAGLLTPITNTVTFADGVHLPFSRQATIEYAHTIWLPLIARYHY